MTDFTEAIMAYLRARRGKLVQQFELATELTRQIEGSKDEIQKARGRVLNALVALKHEKRIIFYPYKDTRTYSERKQRCAGFVRISERFV